MPQRSIRSLCFFGGWITVNSYSEAGVEHAFLNARYYNPATGQFISQDTVFKALGNTEEIKKLTQIEQNKVLEDPQSLNSYSYARNNPVTLSDPNGEFVILGPAAASIVTSAFTYTINAITAIKFGEIFNQTYHEIKNGVPYDRGTMRGDILQVGLGPVVKGIGVFLGTAKEAQQLKVLFQTIDVVDVLSSAPEAVGEVYSDTKNFVKNLFSNKESTNNDSMNQSTKTQNGTSSTTQNNEKKSRENY